MNMYATRSCSHRLPIQVGAPAFSSVESTGRSPAFDLALTTRVLSVTGMEEMAAPAPLGQGKWYGVDRNPATGTMTAEFDCPADAW